MLLGRRYHKVNEGRGPNLPSRRDPIRRHPDEQSVSTASGQRNALYQLRHIDDAHYHNIDTFR